MAKCEVLVLEKKDQILPSNLIFLHEAGFNLDFTTNSESIIELMVNKNYDILLAFDDITDIPIFELLYKLKSFQRGIPTVILSKELSSDDILLAFDLGCYDIISRDTPIEEVAKIIESATTRRSS